VNDYQGQGTCQWLSEINGESLSIMFGLYKVNRNSEMILNSPKAYFNLPKSETVQGLKFTVSRF
jgi:hypothetical protein